MGGWSPVCGERRIAALRETGTVTSFLRGADPVSDHAPYGPRRGRVELRA